MKVYLAGEQEGTALPKTAAQLPRRLMSYYYHGYRNGNQPSRDVLAMAELKHDLFLDCGAFSAKAKGETIDLAGFMDYCQRTAEFWTVVAALDVIGDDAATWQAFEIMRDAGIKAIPTFHYGEPWHVLEKMCREVEYMAFGGLVGVPSAHRKEWLDKAWDIACDADGKAYTKVHGFGVTTLNLMGEYPWHSVDSTSWLKIAAFGHAVFPLLNTGRILNVCFSAESPSARKMEGPHYDTMNDLHRAEVDAALAAYGVTAAELAAHHTPRQLLNAMTFRGYEARGITKYVRKQTTFAFDDT